MTSNITFLSQLKEYTFQQKRESMASSKQRIQHKAMLKDNTCASDVHRKWVRLKEKKRTQGRSPGWVRSGERWVTDNLF